MSHGEEKAKRWRIWRPRFSMRTLIVVLSLACVSIPVWRSTNKHAERLTNTRGKDGRMNYHSAPAPLIVTQWETEILNLVEEEDGNRVETAKAIRKRRYYLWLFGPQVKLFERTAKDVILWRRRVPLSLPKK